MTFLILNLKPSSGHTECYPALMITSLNAALIILLFFFFLTIYNQCGLNASPFLHSDSNILDLIRFPFSKHIKPHVWEKVISLFNCLLRLLYRVLQPYQLILFLIHAVASTGILMFLDAPNYLYLMTGHLAQSSWCKPTSFPLVSSIVLLHALQRTPLQCDSWHWGGVCWIN